MKRFYSSLAAVSTTIVLAACSDAGEDGGSVEITVGGDRPVTAYVPAALDLSKPAPLFVLLHGYGVSGLVQEFVFNLRPQAEKHGFLYVFPDGTIDADNKRFWNATDACCDFGETMVDDVGYLSGLVEEISQHAKVDPKRIYFLGHSNGGFMSHRMACDRSDLVAGIVSLAGSTWLDQTKCNPKNPVAVLDIHGDADDTVLYAGDTDYPGAVATTEIWAQKDGCALTPTAGEPLDLDENKEAETKVSKYESGCQPGGAAELWTIEGGTHVPKLGLPFSQGIVDWLLAHPKP